MSVLLTTTTSGGDSTQSMIMMVVWIVVLFAGFYFLAIRPQKKEQEKKNNMLKDIAVGDSVLTTSGFYGTIIDVDEADVIVEFGGNKNCRITMRKDAIMEVEKPEDSVKEPATKETKKDSKVKEKQ